MATNLRQSKAMIDLSELGERERWEYLWAKLGAGQRPRAGRPKKDSEVPKWRDFGLTRKEVWCMRRLAEIPEKDLDAFFAEPRKRSSYRAISVRFGKIIVPSENDFDGTPLGDLACSLLAPCERLVNAPDGPTKRGRRLLKRALQARLRQIFAQRDAPS